MATSKDPTEAIRRLAGTLSGARRGKACNQSSFKTGKGAFLFIGPGAKRAGFKAMFRLRASLPEARRLAAARPDRFEVGSTGWATARFTEEEPLPRSLWERWLAESHALAGGEHAREGPGGGRRA